MRKMTYFAMLSMVLLSLSACGENNSKPESNADVQTIVEEESSNSDVEVATIDDVPASDSDIDTTEETDMDIVTRAGHPTYYGSVEASHEIWDDVEKGRIHFGDKSYGYNDTPILTMDANRNSDIIRQVVINFENFNEHPAVTLEDALSITATYMPYEIMDQYYEFKGSEMLVPEESRKDDPTYYVVSYRLTEEGSSAYYAKEHEYSGTIDVIIQVNNGSVQNINISFGTPRWMSSLSTNSYLREDWSCDLYDYKK